VRRKAPAATIQPGFSCETTGWDAVHLTNMLWVRVLNDLLHDLTAGFVPGAVLALWMARRGAASTLSAQALSPLVASWSWVVLLLFIALFILVVTGAVRLNYRTRNTREDALPAQGRAATIKHVVFVAVFVFSVVVAFSVLQ
jgi:hypothetical protein